MWSHASDSSFVTPATLQPYGNPTGELYTMRTHSIKLEALETSPRAYTRAPYNRVHFPGYAIASLLSSFLSEACGQVAKNPHHLALAFGGFSNRNSFEENESGGFEV